MNEQILLFIDITLPIADDNAPEAAGNLLTGQIVMHGITVACRHQSLDDSSSFWYLIALAVAKIRQVYLVALTTIGVVEY